MKLIDILNKDLVILLKNKKKDNVLDELLELICDKISIKDKDEFREQFFSREELMSTGIGLGIGVPHIRTDKISSPVIAVGILPEGVEGYVSLDDQPVRIVFMIMIRTVDHNAYIGILSQIATLFKNDKFLPELIQDKSSEDIFDKLYSAVGGING